MPHAFVRNPGGQDGRVLCFGEALIDMLRCRRNTPGAADVHAERGGAPYVAVAVARLGGDAHFVGCGNDMFGDFLLRELQDARWHRWRRAYRRRQDALAFVALDEGGERSFSFYRPPAADLLFRDVHFRDDLFQVRRAPRVLEQHDRARDRGERRWKACAARVGGRHRHFDMNLRPMLWPVDADPLPGCGRHWCWRMW